MTSLLDLLRDPGLGESLDNAGWNQVLEHAQKTQVLGQWSAQATRFVADGCMPAAVRHRIALATLTARRRVEAASWEIHGIRRALSADIPLVVLKGMAHALAGDECGKGRTFSDIDIMVPRTRIEAAESALIADGWQPASTTAYDARYYREWMHELPPMTHVRRRTALDLHHSILPVISPHRLDAVRLFESAQPVGDGIYVLSATDRIVHCAVHMVVEGDETKVLRAAYDLHLLIAQHGVAIGGRDQVVRRARTLGVEALVEIALATTELLFSAKPALQGHRSTRVVRHLLAAANANAGVIPSVPLLSRFWIAIASHRAKMPMHVLLPHLLRKSVTGAQSG